MSFRTGKSKDRQAETRFVLNIRGGFDRAYIADLTVSMPVVEQSIQSAKKVVELKNGVGSTSKDDKSKDTLERQANGSKDVLRVSSNGKALASSTAASQRIILTKKPEGIQISRSKHWKFISSYHGPYIPWICFLL